MDTLKLYDVIALLHDRPEDRLVRGQVGTIVDELAPGIFDVEFADTEGTTYAMAVLPTSDLMRLCHQLIKAA